MKKLILILACMTLSNLAYAKFEVMSSTGYSSNTDGKTLYSFSDLTNHLFLGASVDSKEKIVVGQNISIISNQFKTATTDKLSTMELGPRLMYYFNTDRNFYTAVTWNPYAKGTRVVSGVSEEISGWSYLVSFGAILKMNNSFFMGASLNYHSLAISKSIVSNTATTVSHNYSSLMPMLNLAFRFR